VVWGLGALLLLLAGILLTLPLWFPWLLTPLTRKQGIHYAKLERQGYSHFVFHDVGFTNATARFHADEAETLTPLPWLWQGRLARSPNPQNFVRVTGWQLEIVPSDKPGSSVYTNIADAAAAIKTLNEWVPAAALTNGVLLMGGQTIQIPFALLVNGQLHAQIISEKTPPATLEANLLAVPAAEIYLAVDSLHFDSRLQLAMDATGATITGTNRWLSNRVELDVRFDRQQTLPISALLNARSFRFPAALVQIPEYGELSGSLSAQWDGQRYTLDLKAESNPLATETNLPPLRLALQARGDTNSATLQRATLSGPWLQVALQKELTVHYTGQLLRQPASVTFEADLSKQPWIALQGSVKGAADLSPGAGRFPVARFALSGSGVSHALLKSRELKVAGVFEWPQLSVTESRVVLDDGSVAAAQSRVDLEKKLVESGHAEVTDPIAARWLPAGISYDGLRLAGNFHGPFAQLAHEGSLQVTNFIAPQWKPIRLEAVWRGEGLSVKSARVNGFAGNSSFTAEAAVAYDPRQTAIHLTSLRLRTNQFPVLELSSACDITASKTQTGGWQLNATPLDWRGTNSALRTEAALEWPTRGRLELALQNISSELLADFSETAMPHISIRHLTGTASWSNGPINLSLDLLASGILPTRNTASNSVALPLDAALSLRGDAQGIVLTNLAVTSRTGTVAVAQGFLPLKIEPSGQNGFLQRIPNEPLRLTATAQPHAFFWNELAGWSGLLLVQPDLKVNVGGNWESPEGEVNLQARQIKLSGARINLPSFEDLRISLQLNRQEARLTEGHLLVQGQPVVLTGTLPLGGHFWSALDKMQIPDLDEAQATLRIEHAEVAAFEKFLPNVLSPQGELSLAVELKPGGVLNGALNLQDARTRPLGNLGALRDIHLQLHFLDRTVKLEGATASIGGAPIALTGEADLRGDEWLHGELPPCQFHLRGLNVPLARQPEIIVRSDLDLVLTRSNNATPIVSGTAHLRDSFYLSDLRDLVPGKVEQPNRRPPFSASSKSRSPIGNFRSRWMAIVSLRFAAHFSMAISRQI